MISKKEYEVKRRLVEECNPLILLSVENPSTYEHVLEAKLGLKVSDLVPIPDGLPEPAPAIKALLP